MKLARTSEGLEVRLRPRGVGRFFSAGFLFVWLCGWAAGEAFALWILVWGGLALLTGTSPSPGSKPLEPGPALLMGLFLLLWLALWTLGGWGAAWELLRLISSEDRIVARHDALVVHRRLGPFRRTTTLARPDLLRIYGIARRWRLMAETSTGPVELSSHARDAECETLAAALREETGLSKEDSKAATSLPEHWREVADPEGGTALVEDEDTRRTRGRVAWAVTVIFASVTLSLAAHSWDHPATLLLAGTLGALTILLAWGSWRISHTRLEWRLDSGLLRLRRRSARWTKELFEASSLELVEISDSDGDPWFTLNAVAPGGRRTRRKITRVMDDPTVPRRLGAWLAERTRLSLDDRATAEHKKEELAALIARLEAGGRFSRWVARHTRRC